MRWNLSHRLNLHHRLLASFLAVTVLVVGLALTLGVITIVASLYAQASRQVERNVSTAEMILATRVAQVRQVVQFFATEPQLNQIETTREPAALRKDLERRAITENQLDFLAFADAQGMVRLRAAAPYRTGDRIADEPIFREAYEGKETDGILVLPLDRLEQESGRAAADSRIRLVPTKRARAAPSNGDLHEAMAVWAAVPVRDSTTDQVRGVVYGGVVLNGKSDFISLMQSHLFGEAIYQDKPQGTVTIFLDDVRIATNVKNPDGTVALGTRASAEVYDQVVGRGQDWLGKAFVVDDWYLSAYRPIHGQSISDPQGHTVGMLYVGALEAVYRDLRNDLLLWFLAPGVAGIIGSIFFAAHSSRQISRPVEQLVGVAEQIARGELDKPHEVIGGFPEIDTLIGAVDDMRDRLRERDVQIQRRNEELREALHSVRSTNRGYMEMLGFVTHELKSPVASMYAAASALQGGTFDGDSADAQRRLIATIVRNCEYLEDMVKNYLDLSRIEKGELAVSLHDVDLLQDILIPCIEQLQQQAHNKRITVHCDVPEGVAVRVDPDLARIALSNFVSNAIKYGREDGRIEVRARRVDCLAKVSVWNEGQGFGSDQADKLFRKFGRLSDAQTKRQKGSGLGLYLVREIVERHGGKTGAASEPGQWAEFWLTLPISDQTKGTLMNELRKVLIVDDDVDLADTLKTVMEQDGFVVDTATSGREGLAKARQTTPDVIVLDVKMETLGEGFHVARELRTDDHTRQIPIIMLTSVNQENVGFRYDADEQWNPVDAFLDKPIKPARLIEEIRKIGAARS